MDLRLRSNEVAARFLMKPSGLRSFWIGALSLLGHRSIKDMLPRRFAHQSKNPLSGGIHSFLSGCLGVLRKNVRLDFTVGLN